VREIRAALAEGDGLNMRRAKNDFYDCLMTRCGNGTLHEMLRVIHGRIQLLRTVTLGNPDRMHAAAAEISEIHAAILQRDSEAAPRLTSEHIRNAAAAIRQAWPEADDRTVEPATQATESGPRPRDTGPSFMPSGVQSTGEERDDD
jgi:DNA-binding GntR family transcriptional regulator